MGRAAPVATLALAAALVAALPCTPAAARIPANSALDEWVRDATLVVHAKALRVDGAGGRFEPIRVLKGACAEPEIDVAPLVTQSCIPPPRDRAPFPDGTEVVLFLGSEQDHVFPPVNSGVAWIQLSAQRRGEVLSAVARVVAIEALPAPGERIAAYFGEVESGNGTLRGVACAFLHRVLHGPTNAAPYEDRLVALLRSKVLDARLLAVHSLRFSKSEKALPILLELLDDEVKPVREAASMALAPYDSEVTVRALVASARHPEMLERAIIDLRGSRRPEARALLITLLDSQDPKIRERAARSFYRAVFDGDAVIGKLHGMTADPDLAVRVAVLDALQESPLPETVGVLLDVLRREGLDPKERRNAVMSLSEAAVRVRDRKGDYQALRNAADLPRLMEAALRAPAERNLPHLGHGAVEILRVAWTAEAHALLLRARDGEFGEEVAVAAKRVLEQAAREKR